MADSAFAWRHDPRIFVSMPAHGGMIHAAFAESLPRSVTSLKTDIGGKPRPLIGHYGFIRNDEPVSCARAGCITIELRLQPE